MIQTDIQPVCNLQEIHSGLFYLKQTAAWHHRSTPLRTFCREDEKERWTFYGLNCPLVQHGCTNRSHQALQWTEMDTSIRQLQTTSFKT